MSKKKNPNREAERARAEEIVGFAEALSPTLLDFSVPLYQPDSRDEPEVVGSGVLVAIGHARFLLTAGHVLDRRQSRQFEVGVSPELVTLSGQPMRLRSSESKTTDDDKVDTGIVRLEGGPWDALALNRFLPWSSLDTAIPIVARQSYALVGFPHSVNRRAIQGDRIKAAAYQMGGLECDGPSYAAEHVDPQHNVMIGFDKKAMWGRSGRRVAPDLYGASGSGLWRFGRRIRTATDVPKLSAIATEWHAKGEVRYVLGTRITLIVGALMDKYEDVRAFVGEHQAQ